MGRIDLEHLLLGYQMSATITHSIHGTVTLDYYPWWDNRDEPRRMGSTVLTITGNSITQIHSLPSYPLRLKLDWITRAQLDTLKLMAENMTYPIVTVSPEGGTTYTCVFDPQASITDITQVTGRPVKDLVGSAADRYTCTVTFIVV